MLLDEIPDSPAFEIFNLASKKQAAGEKVFSLAIGEPSFDTPLPIVNAAYESMKSGGGHYSSSWGSKELREAIVEKVRRKNRVNASLENVIFITTKLSIYASLLSLATQAFEALVPDPGYYYSEPVRALRREACEIQAHVGLLPRPRRDRVQDHPKDARDNRQHALQPGGQGLRQEGPEGPSRPLPRDGGSRSISDEAYEDLVYEKKHVSLGSMEASPEWASSPSSACRRASR